MISKITNLFPLWAILISASAYFAPGYFSPYKTLIIPFLIIIMFGMGVTLTWADFRRAFGNLKIIGLGVTLQYIVMPLAAFLLSKALGLSTDLMVGMVLVGSVSGGTASNVITYLARGDVALSITMTALSTLLAVLATPFLTWLYVGQSVPVPMLDMLISILKIVFVPVVLGVLINHLFQRQIQNVQAVFPLISMIAIVLVIGIIVALNQQKIAEVGGIVIIAVMLHNILGLSCGYFSAKALNYDSKIARTIAIEVGMQNSGLGVALAVKYFSPISALPGALFSIWHNLSGSLFASYWTATDQK